MAEASEGQHENKIGLQQLEYIINHVVLPLQLPQADDYSARGERCLLQHALRGFMLFRTILQKGQTGDIEPIPIQHASTMLNNLANIHKDDRASMYINDKALQRTLSQLYENGEQFFLLPLLFS